eukprot:354533-Chlamydomonas_euryale.AAC.8
MLHACMLLARCCMHACCMHDVARMHARSGMHARMLTLVCMHTAWRGRFNLTAYISFRGQQVQNRWRSGRQQERQEEQRHSRHGLAWSRHKHCITDCRPRRTWPWLWSPREKR